MSFRTISEYAFHIHVSYGLNYRSDEALENDPINLVNGARGPEFQRRH
jgi:hypothetical protein